MRPVRLQCVYNDTCVSIPGDAKRESERYRRFTFDFLLRSVTRVALWGAGGAVREGGSKEIFSAQNYIEAQNETRPESSTIECLESFPIHIQDH